MNLLRRSCCHLLWIVLLASAPLRAADESTSLPLRARRILVLGDSITNDGRYIAWIETQLRLQGVEALPELLNLGLSSETCTGLSEPDHPFPRPDVHERLDRALAKVKPDLVVACYGINDGIYYPPSPERFQAYQDGINRLIDKVHAAGAKLVLMTPPPFDPLPMRAAGKLLPAGAEKYSYLAIYENYDDVLKQYSDWIMQQSDRVAMVIDLHSPLTKHYAEQRKSDSQFTMSGDGIHLNLEGQQKIGEIILEAWGIHARVEPPDALFQLVARRIDLLRDAWLSHVGHKRPGVAPGLPLADAQAQAKQLEEQMQPLINNAREPSASTRRASGGMIYQVHYAPTLRSGMLSLGVDYFLWIPDNVDQLRGVIVHQHGCGAGASIGGQTAADDLHWQALAAKWNCALLGSSYEPRDTINCRDWCDPRNGSGQRFLEALAHFAGASQHAELQHIPWCLWGHSGGAFWASLMHTQHAERIVAIWLRSGTAYSAWSAGEIRAPEIPSAAYGVPVLGNPGLKEKDDPRFHRAWDGLVAMQQAYQARGAFFEFAADPRTGHECGDSRYLAIPFFDFWLQHRLSDSANSSPALRPITDEARSAWHEVMAPKLAEYTASGSVSDATPPPAPQQVTAQRNGDGTVTVSWQASADFESGLRAFVIERDGEPIGQVPETPVGHFGRPLFQAMSYHDTPQQPLPAMQFVDASAAAGTLPSYSVRSVNSMELVGPAANSRERPAE